MMNGINYQSWAIRINTLLRPSELWETIEDVIDIDEEVAAVSSKKSSARGSKSFGNKAEA
jgi:hypothetical protein